jgi:hypothetical protein
MDERKRRLGGWDQLDVAHPALKKQSDNKYLLFYVAVTSSAVYVGWIVLSREQPVHKIDKINCSEL